MSALTLTPKALYEEVAELLRQRIFSNELAPGSWIDELRLAEAYGISRTPFGSSECISTKPLTALNSPSRSPDSCVPPAGVGIRFT